MEHEGHEHRDLVTEIENFAIIFGLVCLVSWILRTLFKPFRGVGWPARVIGFIVITLLLLSITIECVSIATAEERTELESVTVVATKANLRANPKFENNIVGTASKGTVFQPAVEAFMNPNWIVVRDKYKPCYVHRSTVKTNVVKKHHRLSYVYLCLAALALYTLAAWRCHVERKRRFKAFFQA